MKMIKDTKPSGSTIACMYKTLSGMETSLRSVGEVELLEDREERLHFDLVPIAKDVREKGTQSHIEFMKTINATKPSSPTMKNVYKTLSGMETSACSVGEVELLEYLEERLPVYTHTHTHIPVYTHARRSHDSPYLILLSRTQVPANLITVVKHGRRKVRRGRARQSRSRYEAQSLIVEYVHTLRHIHTHTHLITHTHTHTRIHTHTHTHTHTRGIHTHKRGQQNQ
jgi:hypothetical protein